jgi:hypothetical protein
VFGLLRKRPVQLALGLLVGFLLLRRIMGSKADSH